MTLVTEKLLRDKWKRNYPETFTIEPDTKLTPSAREFLNQNKIAIVMDTGSPSPKEEAMEKKVEKVGIEKNYPYRLYGAEAYVAEKPEEMTAIFSNELVYKNHPRIKFRGLLDSLEAEILCTRAALQDLAEKPTAQGLLELYYYVRKILRAEVTGEVLQPLELLGFSDEEIKTFSHRPECYFGTGHLMLTGEEPLAVLQLNRLRTKVREVELGAYDAFQREEKFERQDILRALNRLSSAFYVLELIEKTGRMPKTTRVTGV